MVWILVFLACSYLFLIAAISHLWFHKKQYTPLDKTVDGPFFSVIVPARNEEKGLPRLLQSIADQEMSTNNYDVIVVDDHSTDRTAEIAKQFPGVRCLSLNENPGKNNKKRAIQAAVEASRGTVILTTDADCVWPKHLLSTVRAYFEERPCDVLCGPVSIVSSTQQTLLQKFEQIDMAGMMLVTSAGIDSRSYYLGNGAFLAYKKTAYLEVEPFHDNWEEASGDDVFLTKAMAEAGKKVDFLKSKDLIVQTRANASWSEFIQQRLRWSQKNKKLGQSPGLALAMGIPFLFCLLLVLTTLFLPVYPQIWLFILVAWLIKLAADLLLFLTMRHFFKMKVSIVEALLLSPLHCLYIAAFGLAGLFHLSYEWKSVKA